MAIHAASDLQIRVRRGWMDRYQIKPSLGCVGVSKKAEILITTQYDEKITCEMLAGDEFVTELIPVHEIYYFPEAVQSLFEV